MALLSHSFNVAQFLIHDTGGYDMGVMVSRGQILGRIGK